VPAASSANSRAEPPQQIGVGPLVRHILERLEPVAFRDRAPQPAEHAGHRNDIDIAIVTERLARPAPLQQQRQEVPRLGD